ncbi:MAG TPA: hypothetical protein ENG45_01745, partial [Candidatus Aenigmarchaeota archaeon]|nr:hypothetical protein [Candidatus Aenigmarchaeota archaeon]
MVKTEIKLISILVFAFLLYVKVSFAQCYELNIRWLEIGDKYCLGSLIPLKARVRVDSCEVQDPTVRFYVYVDYKFHEIKAVNIPEGKEVTVKFDKPIDTNELGLGIHTIKVVGKVEWWDAKGNYHHDLDQIAVHINVIDCGECKFKLIKDVLTVSQDEVCMDTNECLELNDELSFQRYPSNCHDGETPVTFKIYGKCNSCGEWTLLNTYTGTIDGCGKKNFPVYLCACSLKKISCWEYCPYFEIKKVVEINNKTKCEGDGCIVESNIVKIYPKTCAKCGVVVYNTRVEDGKIWSDVVNTGSKEESITVRFYVDSNLVGEKLVVLEPDETEQVYLDYDFTCKEKKIKVVATADCGSSDEEEISYECPEKEIEIDLGSLSVDPETVCVDEERKIEIRVPVTLVSGPDDTKVEAEFYMEDDLIDKDVAYLSEGETKDFVVFYNYEPYDLEPDSYEIKVIVKAGSDVETDVATL